MSVVHFQCPSCQAPLRLQNRALFVGRSFDCPDCHESLLIEADGSAGVKAKPLPRSEKIASNISGLAVALQSPMSAWDRLSRRPAMLGWIVAALLAVILLIVVNPGRDREKTESISPIAADSQLTGSGPDNRASTSPSDEQNSKAAIEPDPRIPDADATKTIAKLELPPLPEPATVVEPPRDNKPPAEGLKPAVPPAPAVLSPEAIEAKLRQKIVRFDQIKSAPFVKVLDTVEELAGVPIVWDLDRVDDEQLQKPVTLQLKQTTVGEILDTLLKQVGLERSTIEGKIELRPMAQKG